MNPEAGFVAALVAGLVGSVHCLGMCGGIAGALGLAAGGRTAFVLAYGAGRIASYAVAGMLAGALGATLAGLAGLGPWLRLVMGAMLVLVGLQVALGWRLLAPIESVGARAWRHMAPAARALMPPERLPQALALGALWGWLPCGLVYGMLAAAAATGGPAEGAGFMAAFGLGTLPAMAGLSLASARAPLGPGRRRRALGWLLVAFGAWTAATPLPQLVGSGAGHGPHHAEIAGQPPSPFG